MAVARCSLAAIWQGPFRCPRVWKGILRRIQKASNQRLFLLYRFVYCTKGKQEPDIPLAPEQRKQRAYIRDVSTIDTMGTLLPELWTHILNGTDHQGRFLLRPSIRCFMAPVCRQWHEIVRHPSRAARLALETAVPGPIGMTTHVVDTDAWVEGRLVCATALALQWRQTTCTRALFDSHYNWAAAIEGCCAYRLALTAIASCNDTFIDRAVCSDCSWDHAASALDVRMGSLGERDYITSDWVHSFSIARSSTNQHTFDHVRHCLDELGFTVACRHGSLRACLYLLPRLERAVMNDTNAYCIDAKGMWCRLWHRAIHSGSMPIVRFVFYTMMVSMVHAKDGTFDVAKTAVCICSVDCAHSRESFRSDDIAYNRRGWSDELARFVLGLSERWMDASSPPSIAAVVAQDAGMSKLHRHDSMDTQDHDALDVALAHRAQEWGKALYAALTADSGVHRSHAITGSVALFKALDSLANDDDMVRRTYDAAAMMTHAAREASVSVCSFLLDAHRDAVRHLVDPVAMVSGMRVQARCRPYARPLAFLRWVRAKVCVASEQEDAMRERLVQEATLSATRWDDPLSTERDLMVLAAIEWPRRMLPVAARLLAAAFLRGHDPCIVDTLAEILYKEAIAPKDADDESPIETDPHRDLWQLAIALVWYACTTPADGAPFSSPRLKTALALMCYLGERTGNTQGESLPAHIKAALGGFKGRTLDVETPPRTHRASPEVWRFWAKVVPHTECASVGLGVLREGMRHPLRSVRQDALIVRATVHWLIQHGLLWDALPVLDPFSPVRHLPPAVL